FARCFRFFAGVPARLEACRAGAPRLRRLGLRIGTPLLDFGLALRPILLPVLLTFGTLLLPFRPVLLAVFRPFGPLLLCISGGVATLLGKILPVLLPVFARLLPRVRPEWR